MGDVVNLDALILREDFDSGEGPAAGEKGKSEASKTDLTKGENFYVTLRKPDFQRETSAWSPEQVCNFLEAFIDGELIPAVICWQSASRLTFVIDGARRLSAVIAWLLDDYGAGEESIKFYNNNIPPDQRKVHEKTRALIHERIGSYREIQAESNNPGSNPKLTKRSRSLGNARIPLLWVQGNDSKKAERAFLTINQSAVEIDATEFTILNSRFKPNAVSARAIVRNGTGYKYWKDFSPKGQEDVVRIAKDIYAALYNPPLDPPIKTSDLPVAGFGYGTQTLPLIFDFVNIANEIQVIDSSKFRKKKKIDLAEGRLDEDETIECLRRAQKLAWRFTGTHPSSLGLHPAVYFYAANGKHQPTAVLAIGALLMDLEKDDKLSDLTHVRMRFESFLIEHKMFINQLTTQHGSMAKGFRPMRDYYGFVLDQFIGGMDEQQVEETLKTTPRYQRLVKEKPIVTAQSKEFSRALKQFTVMTEILNQASLCRICGARIDLKAMHHDHKQEKSLGGLGSAENHQFAHPYCDSTYKRLTAAAVSR